MLQYPNSHCNCFATVHLMTKKVPSPRRHVQRNVENWTLSYDVLNNISRDCGIVLSMATQLEVRSLLWDHISVAKDEMAAPEMKPILALIDRIIRSCEELATTLLRLDMPDMAEDLDAEVLSHALRRAEFGALPLDRLTKLLFQLSDSCEQAREDIERRSFGDTKPGPRERPNLQMLIWYLSYVFEQGGRKPTANYGPEAKMPDGQTGGRNTPFIRFVHALMQHLPPELRIDFRALGEIIHRALKAKPKGWSPY